jgi:hypothetical protein
LVDLFEYIMMHALTNPKHWIMSKIISAKLMALATDLWKALSSIGTNYHAQVDNYIRAVNVGKMAEHVLALDKVIRQCALKINVTRAK